MRRDRPKWCHRARICSTHARTHARSTELCSHACGVMHNYLDACHNCTATHIFYFATVGIIIVVAMTRPRKHFMPKSSRDFPTRFERFDCVERGAHFEDALLRAAAVGRSNALVECELIKSPGRERDSHRKTGCENSVAPARNGLPTAGTRICGGMYSRHTVFGAENVFVFRMCTSVCACMCVVCGKNVP